ncbi:MULTISPECIES: helix-turn-helix transcriptional regulator [Enterobacteriaceae]|nr:MULTISPECIES: AlpA family phage regulatory protein [Enterobacteriaceae]MDD9123854.1 AlpA family phage regulatory protein [Escherichia coli]MDM3432327.1 AlpA family phage regulatory protein [Citrobacter sp. Cb023]UQQ50475.1 AlpA family phage regulatory protein [Enterobacter roggenkampii]WFO43898.1 AlpA family phage regulatory protein [Citrobacter braakii]WFY36569.1 AlpA family phage regulatory protein [Citrobacter braakii]
MKNKPTMSDKVVALHQPQRLIRIDTMLQLLDCSRTTLYRWVKAGIFPQPIMHEGRTVGWPANTYQCWLEQNNK